MSINEDKAKTASCSHQKTGVLTFEGQNQRALATLLNSEPRKLERDYSNMVS